MVICMHSGPGDSRCISTSSPWHYNLATASKPVPEGLTESELDSSSSKIHCRQSYTKQKITGEKALKHFSPHVSGAHRKTAWNHVFILCVPHVYFSLHGGVPALFLSTTYLKAGKWVEGRRYYSQWRSQHIRDRLWSTPNWPWAPQA